MCLEAATEKSESGLAAPPGKGFPRRPCAGQEVNNGRTGAYYRNISSEWWPLHLLPPSTSGRTGLSGPEAAAPAPRCCFILPFPPDLLLASLPLWFGPASWSPGQRPGARAAGPRCVGPGAAAGTGSPLPPRCGPRAAAREAPGEQAGNLWSVYTFWLRSPARRNDEARCPGRELEPQAPRQVRCPGVSLRRSGHRLPGRARLKTKVQAGRDQARKPRAHPGGLESRTTGTGWDPRPGLAVWHQVQTGHGPLVSPLRHFFGALCPGPGGPDFFPFVAWAWGR